MKQTSKRLQALVLVLAMCVSFLQIPSFAADGHNGDVTARSTTFESDGSFTITKSCDAHPNASEATESGKIVAKKDGTYVAVDKDGKELANVDASATKNIEVGCNNDGSITYYNKVDGKTFYSDKFVTAKATGKHTAVTAEDKAKSYEVLKKDTEHFKEVSNTATCNTEGLATFAKRCEGCKEFVETFTVKSPIVYHQFIKDEKGNKKVFDKVIEDATCCNDGSKYQYIECKDCGLKLYYTKDDTAANQVTGHYVETALQNAKTFPINRLKHSYEYTVKKTGSGYAYVGGKDLTTANFTATGTCSVENCKCADKSYNPDVKEVKLVADKTVVPEFACVPGSQTYAVTYTIPKNESGEEKDKDVTEEVTVPYYLTKDGDVDHDRTWVYVPDEESYVKATCTKDGHYNLVNPCKVCGDKDVVATVKIPATGKHTAAAAKKENVVAATTKKGGSYDLVVRCADCGEIISSTHKTTAKIVVKASKVTKATNVKGKKAKITVKKAASVTGYQIQYGTKKNFKGAKSVKTKATTKTVSKLAKKKYYVRVRTYKVVDGKTYYSSWSGSKTVTIKK